MVVGAPNGQWPERRSRNLFLGVAVIGLVFGIPLTIGRHDRSGGILLLAAAVVALVRLALFYARQRPSGQ